MSAYPQSLPHYQTPRDVRIGVLWPEPGQGAQVSTDAGWITGFQVVQQPKTVDESTSLAESQGFVHQDVVARREKVSDERFSILSGFYTIHDPVAVQRFLAQWPELVKLLFGALPEVKGAWGPDTKTEIELLEDPEDDSSSLVVHVLTSHAHPFAALDRFDEKWWLSKVGTAAGHLSFSVEP